MSKYQGGYVGNTPGWANQNRSGVWDLKEQVSLKQKNQWPFEDGTVTLKYILRNFSCNEGTSYDSGNIVITKDPDIIFWALSNSSQTYGSGTVGFSQVGGGGFGVGDDGDKNFGAYGEEPRGAVYLSWRRPVIVQVSTVNGSGGITSIATQQLGKGLKDANFNTLKTFTSTSAGTGATFNVNRNGSNLTTATLAASGSGYSPGDILSWVDNLGDGSGTTMDPYWDVLLHGIAGAGGSANSAGGSYTHNGVTGNSQQPNFVGSPSGGGSASGLQTPASGVNGGSDTGDYNSGGGGGGAGWGAGAGGPGGGNGASPGKAGFSPLNTTYVTSGAASATSYAGKAIELLVNGVQVKLISSAIDSYSLAS